MIASLGMYDRPEQHEANDALWAGIRRGLMFGPAKLDRETPPWDVWQDKGLVFSQTCGMPYRTKLHRTVKLVGTADYGLDEAPPGYYYSVLLVRAADSDDPAEYQNRVLGYNDEVSQSGWAAPQNHAAERGFTFANAVCTGAHIDSARAVASGRADIAAIDAVSWRMIGEQAFASGKLKVIAKTAPTPGLPFITSLSQDAPKTADAIHTAIASLGLGHRMKLGIEGVAEIPAQAYLDISTPPGP